MSEFINTADVIGDDEMFDQIIMRTVTEYKEDRISKVGQYAFYKCTQLAVVDVPNVTSISSNSLYGCSALTALILRGATVCTLANTNALTNSAIAKGTGYIYVPRELVDSYKAATNWSTYADQFRALEDYTHDGTVNGSFFWCSGITLDQTSLTFDSLSTVTLTATMLTPSPHGFDDNMIKWSSSDTSVATVNNGVVTPVNKGTAIITVSHSHNGYSATCEVAVSVDGSRVIQYEVGSISYSTGDNQDDNNKFRTSNIPYDPDSNTFRADIIVNGNTSANARLLLRPYKSDGTFISGSFASMISPAASNNWAVSGTTYTFNAGSEVAYVRAVFADSTDKAVSTLTGTITVSGITYKLL